MVELTASDSFLVMATATVFAALVGLAEWLHARRTRRLQTLAFGPQQQVAAWVRFVPFARAAATGGLAGALVTLMLIKPMSHRKDGEQVSFEKLKHVVLVLDVSPSMRLQDAGPDGKKSRLRRAREVMESYFQRVPMNEFRITVIAVYTDAFPVVEDTRDAAVVRNILDDLPMHFAFVPGDTDLFAGIRKAAEVTRGWRPQSTTVILVADGDTVPTTGMPRMPASVSDVLVVGVGDPNKGSFINGHNSRQDVSALRQISARLGGTYHNGNEKHLSTALIERLTKGMEGESGNELSVREAALLVAGLSIQILALLPLALHYYGTSWRPGRRRAKPEPVDKQARHPATREESRRNKVEQSPLKV